MATTNTLPAIVARLRAESAATRDDPYSHAILGEVASEMERELQPQPGVGASEQAIAWLRAYITQNMPGFDPERCALDDAIDIIAREF